MRRRFELRLREWKQREQSQQLFQCGSEGASCSGVRQQQKGWLRSFQVSWHPHGFANAKIISMNAQGQLWSQQETEVQPLAVQFFRQQAQLKLTGAMAREYLSIAVMIDLGLQGRIAELTDVGTQRFKSLLATASGLHFSIAQKMEVVPLDRTAPESLLETREATRAHQDEERDGKGKEQDRGAGQEQKK